MITMNNDLISRQAAIETVRKAQSIGQAHRMLLQLPPAQLAQDLPKGCTDTISRAAVVDVIEGVDWYHQNKSGEMVHGANDDEHQAWYKAEDIYKAIECVPSAQPGQRNARVFQGIIVEYPSISAYPEYEGKPYFSIKYTENGQEFIGYGTYKPEVLSEYLKEYFMPSAQPGWIPCTPETMPKNKSNVLTVIYIPGRQAHIRSGWYEDGLFMNDNGDTWKATDKEVVGWMYQPKLPNPREGGQDGKN